mmetsp:Transcript_14644/g.33528  ORF Transcript_14644/g.33528 Transcript_14644/m.33528 type:complete len:463 (-) Transcript_14644:998-2386(-)
MLRPRAAVATDIHVVALGRGDQPQVLARRLCALAEATRDTHLDLVRRPEALVAILQGHRHAHRVLLPVAAPRASHATLHRPQGLAIGMPSLQTRLHELLPDRRQLMRRRSIHAKALRTRDLRPQAELLRDAADGNELIGRDVSAGASGNHRVRPRLLDVRQEAVVRVLDLVAALAQDVLVPQPGQDRRHDGLAELATLALAHGPECVLQGPDLLDLDDVEELPPVVGEVSADAIAHRLAQGLESGRQNLRDISHGSATTPATRARLCALLHLSDRRRLLLHDGLLDVSLAHVQAAADHVLVRKARAVAPIHSGARGLPGRRPAKGEALRGLPAEVLLLAQLEQLAVVLRVAHEHSADEPLPVGGEAQLPVRPVQVVEALEGPDARVLAIELPLEPEALVAAEGRHVHAHQLQLRAQVALLVLRRLDAFSQICRESLRLLHARRPQAIAEGAPDGCDLTDGID